LDTQIQIDKPEAVTIQHTPIFTRYLEQFAIFKKEAEIRAKDEENFGFEIQRINPHISTSRLPALEEERPGDTTLDPFGYSLTEITENEFSDREREGDNIYRNKKFLKRLYKVFVAEEADYEHQFYSFFANFSNKFEELWNDAQKDALNHYFDNETGRQDIDSLDNNIARLEDKIAIIRTAAQQDPGAEKSWLNIIDDQNLGKKNRLRDNKSSKRTGPRPRLRNHPFRSRQPYREYRRR